MSCLLTRRIPLASPLGPVKGHRSPLRRVLGLLMLATLLAPLAAAKTIHVKTGGNDGLNGGSWSNAKYSLANAFMAAAAGDTILVEPGTYRYNDPQAITKSGNASKYITVKVASERTSNVNAVFTGDYHSGNILDISGRYIRFDGRASGTFQALVFKNSKANGVRVSPVNGNSTPHHIEFRNVKFTENTYSGLVISRGREQSSASAKGSSPYNIKLISSDVSRNSLINSSRTAGDAWPGAVACFESNDVTVSATNVYQNFGEGVLFMGSRDCDVVNSFVGNNYSVNVYFDCSSFGSVKGSYIGGTDSGYYRNGYPANGVQISNENQFYSYNDNFPARNIEIAGNTIADCGYGFTFWRDNGTYTRNTSDNVLTNVTFRNTDWQRNGKDVNVDRWAERINVVFE